MGSCPGGGGGNAPVVKLSGGELSGRRCPGGIHLEPCGHEITAKCMVRSLGCGNFELWGDQEKLENTC